MAGLTPANLALEGGDPRKSSFQAETIAADAAAAALGNGAKGRVVSFEEYMYYAEITRAEEKEANARFIAARGPRTWKNLIQGRFSKGRLEKDTVTTEVVGSITTTGGAEKSQQGGESIQPTESADTARYGVTGAQRETAGRALRTASWGTIFYLITTDILGPMGAP